MIDIMAEVLQPPEPSVAGVMGRHRYSADVSYENSESDPPGFGNGPANRDSLFDFELFLGQYDPSNFTITVFSKGIQFVANEIDCEPDILRHIVHLHEHAHSLHHVGSSELPAAKGNELSAYRQRKDSAFRTARRDIKEQIAQLATLLAIRRRRDSGARQVLIDTFLSLMRRQSEAYRLPGDTIEADLPRLERKLRLLLNMTDDGLSPSVDQVRGILE